MNSNKRSVTVSANSIGVDSGMIMVGDLRYLDSVPLRDDRAALDISGQIFDQLLIPGLYELTWNIPETYNGDIKGHRTLDVRTGDIFVCDPCYIIGGPDEEWMDWLNANDYGRDLKSDEVMIIDEMGGDGCYKVMLSFRRIGDLKK